ncbi:putative DNA polymerase lambda-like, partial [Apostichopus japonicus]
MEKKRVLEKVQGCPLKRRKIDQSSSPDKEQTDKIFSGYQVFVLSAGLGKARTDIFNKQLSKQGAEVCQRYNQRVSFVIVDEKMTSERFLKITNISQDDFTSGNAVVVKANWLSTCLSEEKVINTSEFELFIDFRIKDNEKPGKGTVNDTEAKETTKKTFSEVGETKNVAKVGARTKSPKKTKEEVGYDSDDSNYVPSDEDGGEAEMEEAGERSTSNQSTPTTSPTKLPRGNWVCAKPSTSQSVNLNEHITEKLEVLMNAYKNTKDQWRALGYRKAIGALKSHPRAVTTWEEASAIPGIGSRLADKIAEIVQSGHLRKIDHICQGEEAKILDLFNNIWGVGPTVAQGFVQLGYKTLEDVRTKAKLNKQQQIGLSHYYDFLDRMPRDEAAEIGKLVEDATKEFNPNFVCTTCGSFRRGKKTCGDVDVLISHLDGHSHKGILFKLLEKLHSTGFLTDDLIKVEERGEQKKYMGVCRLPGENRK